MTRFALSSAPKRRRVLVVDEDDDTRASFVAVLGAAGFEVAEAWGAVQGIRLMLSFRPDAVVLDLVLPDGHGFEVGRAMRAIVIIARTCVVAVTGSAAAVGLVNPASFGAEEILLKPVEPAATETGAATLPSCGERQFFIGANPQAGAGVEMPDSHPHAHATLHPAARAVRRTRERARHPLRRVDGRSGIALPQRER